MFLSSGKDGPSQEAPPGHEVKSLGIKTASATTGRWGFQHQFLRQFQSQFPRHFEKRKPPVMTNIAAIAMENHHAKKRQTSISIRAIYTMAILNKQRVNHPFTDYLLDR